MNKRLHALVDGHVQGVGFRWSCVKWARQRRLRGWIRNLESGSVEIVAESDEDALLWLLAKLRKGPSGARVIQVRDTWTDATGEFSDFQIRS